MRPGVRIHTNLSSQQLQSDRPEGRTPASGIQDTAQYVSISEPGFDWWKAVFSAVHLPEQVWANFIILKQAGGFSQKF